MKQCVKLYKTYPPRGTQPDDAERNEAELQKKLEFIQKTLPSRHERFQNESLKKPTAWQAQLALQLRVGSRSASTCWKGHYAKENWIWNPRSF